MILFVIVYFYILLGFVGPISIIICTAATYGSIIMNDKVKELDAERKILLDQKSRIVSDMILSIKNIKFNAWEDIIMGRLTNLRQKDSKVLLKNYLFQAISTTIVAITPSFIAIIIMVFIKFVLMKEITASTLYIILLYLNFIKKQLIFLNFGVIEINSCSISMERIACFLRVKGEEEESLRRKSKQDSHILELQTLDSKNGMAVGLKGCSFQWENKKYRKQLEELCDAEQVNLVKSDEEFELGTSCCLKDIDLKVKRGDFVAIIGKVGAGKTSLLRAILGDLNMVEGSLDVDGSVAYVPQEAFLINDTLRENILFGKEFNQEKYTKIVEICQLIPDLKILPKGDMTEIGERGLNLSGGQKQRISIARALYSESETYLIDDCMSALDAHVGAAILEKVFFGYLKDKTRVLTTHRYHFLNRVDHILMLEAGKALIQGSYEEVKKNSQISGLIGENDQSFENGDKKENEKKVVKEEFLDDKPKDIFDEKGQKDLSETSKSKKFRIEEEHRQTDPLQINKAESNRTGSIKLRVLKFYLSQGGLWLAVLVVFLFTISTILSISSDLWVGSWAAELFEGLPVVYYPTIYLFLILAGLVIYILKFYLISNLSRSSSFRIFQKMAWNILRKKMRFFDTTPSGILMNRCVEDMEIVDYEYALNIKDISESLFGFFGAIALTMVGSWLMIPLILIMVYFTFLYFLEYLKSSVELKRLFRVSRSKVLSCVTEFMEGSTSIRAHKYTEKFFTKWEKAHNLSLKVSYHERMAKCMLVNILNVLALAIAFSLCFIFYVYKVFNFNFIGGSNVTSLIVTNSISISLMVYFLAIKLGEVINNTSVVERLQDYCVVDEESKKMMEADFYKPEVEEEWPSFGLIEMIGLSLRYNHDLPLVIKDLDFRIEGSEKVGIVGRTGSGKSILLLALTRIIEVPRNEEGVNMGRIEIDGVNISGIGLHPLRRNIAVIPQDPILLEGTLRDNIDPLGEYSDQQVLNILRTVRFKDTLTVKTDEQLKFDTYDVILNLEYSLDPLLQFKIENRGMNLSLGQRQLVCIARAFIRKPKILLMDEATASIDEVTDKIIQKVIMEKMDGTSVVTIAHRLETVMEYDKILVLDGGVKVEDGPPSELMESKGVFFNMVKNSGLADSVDCGQ